MQLPNPPLMFITDPSARYPLPQVVEDACRGGLRWICLRDLTATGLELLDIAYVLRDITTRHGAQLYISRNLGVARQVDADGLHLASHQDAAQMRKLVGDDMIIGQSVHDLPSAQAAIANGVDYVTLSPVFQPSSKEDDRLPLGLKVFKQIAIQLSVPVIALGGINCETLAAAKNAGAAGAGFIGAMTKADDAANAARYLTAAWRA